MKTLDTVCKCGRCDTTGLHLDKHGVWWYWCCDCGWWYLSDWNQKT